MTNVTMFMRCGKILNKHDGETSPLKILLHHILLMQRRLRDFVVEILEIYGYSCWKSFTTKVKSWWTNMTPKCVWVAVSRCLTHESNQILEPITLQLTLRRERSHIGPLPFGQFWVDDFPSFPFGGILVIVPWSPGIISQEAHEKSHQHPHPTPRILTIECQGLRLINIFSTISCHIQDNTLLDLPNRLIEVLPGFVCVPVLKLWTFVTFSHLLGFKQVEVCSWIFGWKEMIFVKKLFWDAAENPFITCSRLAWKTSS